jgi:hypothetical protein
VLRDLTAWTPVHIPVYGTRLVSFSDTDVHSKHATDLQLSCCCLVNALLLLCFQVCAWLARLANKLDAAQSLEAELKPPRSADGSSSNSGSKANCSTKRLPLCKDCLRAAEVARKAAQSMGLQGIDALSAAQLAQGHGRAVCWLLQGIADVVWGQLQLSCKRPSHNTAREDDPLQDEQLQGDDAEDEADIAVAAAVLAAAAEEGSEELDDIHLAHVAGSQQRGSPVDRHAGTPAAADHNSVIQTQVGSSKSGKQLAFGFSASVQ